MGGTMGKKASLRAIIWDFGGVVTTSPFEAFNKFEARQGIPRNTIRNINATNPENNAWAQLESNQISLQDFDKLFAMEAKHQGFTIEGKQVLALLSGTVRPAMVHAIKMCAAKFKVGCLTNTIPGMKSLANDNTQQPTPASKVMKLFHVVVSSAHEGMRKPDARIYHLMCDRLGCAPKEAVFLDDLGINLKPARAMGMHTIKVEDPTKALEELEQLVGFSLQEKPSKAPNLKS